MEEVFSVRSVIVFSVGNASFGEYLNQQPNLEADLMSVYRLKRCHRFPA